MVGHSIGGALVLIFAQTYPEDVAGVVLVDATPPEAPGMLATEFPGTVATQREQEKVWEDLAEQVENGAADAMDLMPLAPSSLPRDLQYQWAALAARPHSLRAVVAESQAVPRILDQVAGEGSLGDIALVVIARSSHWLDLVPAGDLEEVGLTHESAATSERMWRDLQKEHMHRSRDARFISAGNSGHYIYYDEPGVVIDAIRVLTGSP